ncbi:MAG: carbohydrate binding domain-containing protein [Pyrinomonadaceae bacterium]
MPKTALNLESVGSKIGVVVAGLVVVSFLLYSASSFFGDSIAAVADTAELAGVAIGLSPGNAKSHAKLAGILNDSFKDADKKIALQNAEQAVRLSPSDYNLWMSLANLRESNGDMEGAEKAARAANSLAPAYADAQWALGNILLRREKNDEAFKFLKTAVAADKKYAGPAARIAWDIFEGDRGKVSKAIGDSNDVKMALSVYLASMKKFDEAMDTWRSVPAESRAADKERNQKIYAALIASKKYLGALEVGRLITVSGESLPEASKINNPSFESEISGKPNEVFDWAIDAGSSPSIGISLEEKHSGTTSLALAFGSNPGKAFRSVRQVIAVEPGTAHKLRFFAKANLKTSATLAWQIADAVSNEVLATTESIEVQGDWKEYGAEFRVPADSEGVVIRMVRAPCTEGACPITGTAWFDSFELTKTGGREPEQD